MPSPAVEDCHVGIICALDIEMAAVEGMLDEEYDIVIAQDTHDHNAYSVGRIHGHNVVIACLPAGIDGLAAAATVAKDMSRTFRQLRFGLLVGIGGGIPDLERGTDIRLGDIVVSEPTGTTGGVVQYDKGKNETEGKWVRKGTLNAPPTVLLTALQRLKARHLRYDSKVSSLVASMLQRYPKMVKTGYAFPGRDQDCLRSTVPICRGSEAGYDALARPPRETDEPDIHYGIIASGNLVIKDAVVRDFLYQDCGALCVEMEAAGLMNEFPCLVIRGICDYADAHKNDQWHRYAAATAAAYAKELLSYVSPEQTDQERPVQQLLGSLNQHFQQLYTHHTRQEDHFQQQAVQYQNDKQRECHQAFKTSTYEEHKNINPERAPQTCQWLLSHEKYIRWRENHHNDLLWISADPGCGKSVLSKSLVDQDLRSDSSEPRTTICYFFFKDNHVQDGLATALCAVLHQLFDSQPKLIQHAMPAWEKNGGKVASEVPELWRILQAAATDQHAQCVICVLDALDECRDDDRRQLISMLCQFYNDTAATPLTDGKLKFLVTSRPYDDIECHFGRIAASLPSIRLRGEDENDLIRTEIDTVVRAQVREIGKDFHLAPATVVRLERKLLAMEHRTYLWLYLASKSIRATFSQSLRPDRESIDLLPDSVDEAYEQILGKVDPKQIRHVRKILQIIIGARRPLTVGEMALALDVATSDVTPRSFSDLSVNEDQLAARIRHWCGLFVFINHSRLYLIHQTAKEFLLRDPKQAWADGGKWKHCLCAMDIEREMASVYMTYLCLDEFDEHEHESYYYISAHGDDILGHPQLRGILRRSAEREGGKSGLCQLAADSWADHWRSIEATAGQVLEDKAWMFYDMQSRRFSRWTKIRRFGKYPIPYDSGLNSLMLAAYHGHVGITHRILALGLLDVEAQDREGWTALMRGASRGHRDIVALLLDKGANVNTQGNSGTALYTASSCDHGQVVQMLLDRGANVNAQGGRCGTALYAASSQGHEGVIQILLDSGADVNAQGGHHGNALSAAAVGAHQKAVQTLLDNGADVNSQANGDTALYTASSGGHDQVVQLLLDGGADVHAQGYPGDALSAASEKGHEKIVQMLLDHGANVNAQGDYGNALYKASSYGREKIVQILLDNGADVDALRVQYGSALQSASGNGYEKIVQILLDNGADPNADRAMESSALQAALFGGHEQIGQLLLDKGADVNHPPDVTYGSALHAAAVSGSEKLVQALLDKGADVNAQGGNCNSALEAASATGHTKIVQILLDGGADANAQGGLDGGALQTASCRGLEEIVQMLLDRGADPNAQGRNRSGILEASALQLASKNGHTKIVEMLLDEGADANAPAAYDGTALQAASFHGVEEIVQLLLDRGADPDARGRPGLGLFEASALQIVSQNGYEKIVQALLDGGADVNAQGGSDGSALQMASNYGQDNIVRILLNRGADLNLRGGFDGSALQAAINRGQENIVQMLLDGGADVNIRGGCDGSALQAAINSGRENIVQMLLDRGATPISPVETAVE